MTANGRHVKVLAKIPQSDQQEVAVSITYAPVAFACLRLPINVIALPSESISTHGWRAKMRERKRKAHKTREDGARTPPSKIYHSVVARMLFWDDARDMWPNNSSRSDYSKGAVIGQRLIGRDRGRKLTATFFPISFSSFFHFSLIFQAEKILI
ncbi:hypothetical protein AVEN_174114-1 [Araneus ventricosus]|uniref:Uncharacterized protein n=1 Tax=Araneus ventricosus TaxID=182803 RepID=A0A4Y2C1I4_ARAVE|nr:hypothetical protein AVEN_174114-1 [Araneus ventricosus]